MSGQLIINPFLTGLNGIFHLLSSQWRKKKNTHTHTHTLLQEKQNRVKFLIIRLHCTWCSSSILFACSAFQTYNFSSSRLLQVIYKMKNFYLSLTVSANMRPAKILHSSWNLYQLDLKVQCGGGKSHLFSHIDSKPFVIITLWDFVGLGGFFFSSLQSWEGTVDQTLGHLVLSGASKWALELCMRVLLAHLHIPWPVS